MIFAILGALLLGWFVSYCNKQAEKEKGKWTWR